ncbi:MAG: response regulator transcription factor [Treponema sp.]|nr:response regulator transcription factor [Treponema sp.]
MSPKKILIIDDEEINLDFFDVMLSKLGFTVEKARDGIEGMEKTKKFFPDLILLDNIMPRMSGWEFTKAIKKDAKYKEIPIIMLSALDDVKDKVTSFELGIDDYITKPFNFSEVLARIRAALRNSELYAQIVVREFRLDLAEELNRDIKNHLMAFVKSIDELDAAIEKIDFTAQEAGEGKKKSSSLSALSEKSKKVRKQVAELDGRIEKTMAEWERLKKDEIGLSMLETQMSEDLSQEQTG